jgi:hypothetical protein
MTFDAFWLTPWPQNLGIQSVANAFNTSLHFSRRRSAVVHGLLELLSLANSLVCLRACASISGKASWPPDTCLQNHRRFDLAMLSVSGLPLHTARVGPHHASEISYREL